jgi:DnaJ-class molecular chaperone
LTAQEIYDSYGDAGLKGSVPTGPDGSTFKYAPTNAEDIFEQARPNSLNADEFMLTCTAAVLSS